MNRFVQRMCRRLPALLAGLGLWSCLAAASLHGRPDEASIFALRKLPEPLVAAGGVPGDGDNEALLAALDDLEKREKPDDFSALEQFLADHPASPWCLAVGTNLGLLQFRAGLFSRCIPVFLAAWESGKTATGTEAKALADRAAGEYAAMLARLGRYETLKAFLAAVDGREFVGPGKELIASAREGAANMESRPDHAFRCGPMALSRILASQGSPLWTAKALEDSKSTMQGMSLQEVAELSAQVGLNYQPARRSPGAEVLLPAVVHWKAGHYAALIRKVGDRYLSQDPTFGSETWHTREALEAESSGHFLVPPGPLPAGWSVVNTAEASQVFGKGNNGSSNAAATGPNDHSSGGCRRHCCQKGLARYDFHTMLASLRITDTPVGHAPPFGEPVGFTATYAQREAGQPGNFNFSNLGRRWGFNWLSWITDDPANPAVASQATAGGGTITYSYTGVSGGRHVFGPQFDTRAQLSRPTSGLPYTRTLPDGSQEIYGLADGSTVAPRRVFLTQRIDPQGNATVIGYDGQFRLATLTDALGQQTTFSYTLPGDPFKITKVTDPFGRFAQFSYDVSGRLVSIRDAIGMESVFTYQGTGDFINAMTTPYGTTTFTSQENGRQRRLTATNPNGETEVLEAYPLSNNALAFSDATAPVGLTTASEFNQNLYYRNSFHWNRKQWKEAPNDYGKCHIYHWLHDQNFDVVSRYLESEKEPLEARLWYAYPGQGRYIAVGAGTIPNATGEAIEGGSRMTFLSHNTAGQPTSETDPVGRRTVYEYASNDIDLVSISQQIGGAHYTAIDAGGGPTGSFVPDRYIESASTGSTFTVAHAIDLSGVTDPAPAAVYRTDRNGELTYRIPNLIVGEPYRIRLHFSENFFPSANQRKFNVAINGTGVLGNFDILAEAGARYKAVVREFTATPDAGGRIAIQFAKGSTDVPAVAGIEVIAQNQPAATFPATLASFTYNSQHRPLTQTDAAGQTTTFTYNANGQLTSVTNAKSETTTFVYFTTDAPGRQRKGRVQQIDGALPGNADVMSFDYDAVGRVERITGTDGYFLTFTYDGLDRPVRTTFPDGTYTEMTYQALDVATRRDRLGRLTHYEYDGIGQPVSVTDPANRVFRFTWCRCGELRQLVDPLNRITAWKHDLAGRRTQKIHPDGSSIAYAYQPLSGRLLSVTDEKGQVSTMSYNPDDSLVSVVYSNTPVPTPTVAYTYDREFDRAVSMTDGTGTTLLAYHPVAPGAPGAGRLATVDGPLPNDSIAYTYDVLGRTASRFIASVGESVTFDALDRIVSKTNALGAFSFTHVGSSQRVASATFPNGMTVAYGYHPLSGDFRLQSITQTLPGAVPVGQHTLGYDSEGRIMAWTIRDGAEPAVAWTAGYDDADRLTSFLSAGTSFLASFDASDNRLSQSVNGITTTATFDALNQVTGMDGPDVPAPRSLNWDAAHRLVAIDHTGTGRRSEFTYDGMSRCVRIVEKNGATVTADRRFVWCDERRCEERDATGTVVQRRFFSAGEQIGGQAWFHARDHLGNVRQVVGASTVAARYDYEPWGLRTKLPGAVDATFGFTGHLLHEPSGLVLAPRRAYDPRLGRWLSRDPLGESEGPNLFAYVSNQPLRFRDPLGLSALDCAYADWLREQLDRRSSARNHLAGNLFGSGQLRRDPDGRVYEDFDDQVPNADYREAVGVYSAWRAMQEVSPGSALLIEAGNGILLSHGHQWFRDRGRFRDLTDQVEALRRDLKRAECQCSD